MQRFPVVQQNIQKSADMENQNNDDTEATTQHTSSCSSITSSSSSKVSLPEKKLITLHSASLPSVKILPNSGGTVAVSTIESLSSGLNDDNKRGIVVVGGTQQQQKQNLVRVLPTKTTIPLKSTTGQNGNLFLHGKKVVQLQYKSATSPTQGTPVSLITTSGNKKIPITLVTNNAIVSKGTGKSITSPSLIPVSTSSNFVSIGSTLPTVNKINQKPIITSVQSGNKITPAVLLPKTIEKRILPAATVIAVTPNYQQQQQPSTTQPITILTRNNSIKPGPVRLPTNPQTASVCVDKKLSELSSTSPTTTSTVLCKPNSYSNLTTKLLIPKSQFLPPLTQYISSSASSTSSAPSASSSTIVSVPSDAIETKTLSLENFEVFEKLHQETAAKNVKYDYNSDVEIEKDTDEKTKISSSSSSQLPSQQKQQKEQNENDNNNVKDDKHQSLLMNKSIEDLKKSPRTEKRSKSLTTIIANDKKDIKKRQLSLQFDDPLKITKNDLCNYYEKNKLNQNKLFTLKNYDKLNNDNNLPKPLINETNNDDNLLTPMSLLCNESIEISPSSSSSKVETSSNDSIDDEDDLYENNNERFEFVAVGQHKKNNIDSKQEKNQKHSQEKQKNGQQQKEIKKGKCIKEGENQNNMDDSQIFKVPQYIKKNIIEKYNNGDMIKIKSNLNDRILTGIATKDFNKNVIEFLKSDSSYNFVDWSNEGTGATKDVRISLKLNSYGLIEITDDNTEKIRKNIEKNSKENIKKNNKNNNDDDDIKNLPSTSSGFRSDISFTNTNNKNKDEIISSKTSNQNTKNDDDIFVKPTSTVTKSKTVVKKQLRTCLICNYRGLSADFLTPGYCGFDCVQKMQKLQNRRSTSSSSASSSSSSSSNNKDNIKNNNDNNKIDENNKKSIKDENIINNNNKIDDKNHNNNETKNTGRKTLKRKCNEIQEEKKQTSTLSYYKRKKLEKQMQQSQQNKKIDFDWNIYLEKHNAKAAPQELFIKSIQGIKNIGENFIHNPFKTGMKLEAIDPEHQSLFCVCTIVEVNGHRLKLHFDGYPSIYDFWINSNSKNIFPPGWCKETNRNLSPPFGVTPSQFNWQSYLRKTKSVAAPAIYFKHLYEPTERNPFEIGMKLEADDLKNTRTVCVASVSDILGDRILVHFDGWHDLYDYWIEIDSPYIHYIDWHKESNLSIYPPPHWEMGSFTWEEYYKERKYKGAKRSTFPRVRPTLPFQVGQKLEVVDKKNPSLIRPATIVDTAPYELKIVYDGWLQRYAFWIMDDSPDLYPVGWCEANGHDLEPPPGYGNLPNKMPCPIINCRGIGSARGIDVESHSNEDSCPYHPVNWRDKTELPDRLESNETKTKEKKITKRKNEDLKNNNPKTIKIMKGIRTNKKNVNATTTATVTSTTTTKPAVSVTTRATSATKPIISTTENTRILRKSERRSNKLKYEVQEVLIPQKRIKIEPIDNNVVAIIDDKLNANKSESTKTTGVTAAAKSIEVIDTKELNIKQSIDIKNDKMNIKKDLKNEETLTSQSSTVNETTSKTATNAVESFSSGIRAKISKTSIVPKIKTEKPITSINAVESTSTGSKAKTSNTVESFSTRIRAKTSKTSTVPKITTEKPIISADVLASTSDDAIAKTKNAITSSSTGTTAKTSKTFPIPKTTTEKPITSADAIEKLTNALISSFNRATAKTSETSTVSQSETEKPITSINAVESTSTGASAKTSKTSTVPKIKTEKTVTKNNAVASTPTDAIAKTSKTSADAIEKLTNALISSFNRATGKTLKTSTVPKSKTEKSIISINAVESTSTGAKAKTKNAIASSSSGVRAKTSKISTISKITAEIPIINTIPSFSTGATPTHNNNSNRIQNELNFKNVSMNVASHLLCDYGPRLRLAYSIWSENSLCILRNRKKSIFDSVRKNPLSWSATEVSSFMYKIIQIDKHIVKKFIECRIDGPSFLAMRQTDLTNILEIHLGPAIKIYNFIIQLRVTALTKFKKENEKYIHGAKFVFKHYKIEDFKAIRDAKSAKAAKAAAKTVAKATQTETKATLTEETKATQTETKETQTEFQPEVEETTITTTNNVNKK